jgi:omega-6 fatty acid desaturase (delta-12 desaturase)
MGPVSPTAMNDLLAVDAAAEMASRSPTSIKETASFIPAHCYDNPTWRGLALFARDLALYSAAVALLAVTDAPAVLVPAWLLAAAAICGLFVIGHDAAHGALFRNPRLCHVVGQLAFLPSLHAFSVWAHGHNRVHHAHTGCAEIDFVWRPLTPPAYAGLSRLCRLRHRIEWSVWGTGAYYLRTIWWQRMLGASPPPRLRAAFRSDRRIVAAYAAGLTVALGALGAAPGGAVGALWLWVKVFLIPWLLFSQVIGAVVYVQHIAPDVAWWRRQEWSKVAGQLEGTASYRIPSWLNFFWHNIFLHVAHHVDPRVPCYRLPAATAALARRYPELVGLSRLRWRDYRRITRTCKLYDFDGGGWVGYDGRRAVLKARG